jgi:Protein of unknown function (DUF732)
MLFCPVLIAAAIATAAIGSASPAQAAPVDDFINAVHADGITSSNGDDGLVKGGRAVCDMLDVGASRNEVYRGVRENTGLDQGLADKFINDSTTYLCPWQNGGANAIVMSA